MITSEFHLLPSLLFITIYHLLIKQIFYQMLCSLCYRIMNLQSFAQINNMNALPLNFHVMQYRVILSISTGIMHTQQYHQLLSSICTIGDRRGKIS